MILLASFSKLNSRIYYFRLYLITCVVQISYLFISFPETRWEMMKIYWNLVFRIYSSGWIHNFVLKQK